MNKLYVVEFKRMKLKLKLNRVNHASSNFATVTFFTVFKNVPASCERSLKKLPDIRLYMLVQLIRKVIFLKLLPCVILKILLQKVHTEVLRPNGRGTNRSSVYTNKVHAA